MFRSALLFGFVCALAACGPGTVSGIDSPADGGSTSGDGGGSLPQDAGDGFDGGVPDAGMEADAGEGAQDAGTLTPDAGMPSDAGSFGSPGCFADAGLTAGEKTFTLNGRQRRYVVYPPNGYASSRAWPLVFALHGNGGSISYWNSTTGDRNIRGQVKDDAILVIAEAIGGHWRDYSQPSSTWPARMDEELAYFDEILKQLGDALCVDEEEIFSMGFSGGGSFSGVLGCRREYVRAIASGGSVLYFNKADCVNVPATWSTMGVMELDTRGTAFRDYFRGAASCQTTSKATTPSPCIAYDGCHPHTPNHYCEHPGDHVWPSFGTAAAWLFFSQFVD